MIKNNKISHISFQELSISTQLNDTFIHILYKIPIVYESEICLILELILCIQRKFEFDD